MKDLSTKVYEYYYIITLMVINYLFTYYGTVLSAHFIEYFKKFKNPNNNIKALGANVLLSNKINQI